VLFDTRAGLEVSRPGAHGIQTETPSAHAYGHAYAYGV
jgi:hypothetical protein